MPTTKDFKQKAREATARAHLLQTRPSPKPAHYARLAGKSDATIKAATGCTWVRWVKALDYAGAHAWPHRRIAEYVHEKYKVPGWWSQTVTVGYERIKGRRAVGQRLDGGFYATKSKTFAAPLSRLYRAWADRRQRARWLDGVALTVRRATRSKSMRITWPDATSVEVWFTRKADAGPRRLALFLPGGDLP